jgi:hypothetical protein
MAASVEGAFSASSSIAGNFANEGLDGAARQDYDVNLLRAYLELLLPVVMSTSERTLSSTMFSRSSSWRDTLEHFASDPSIVVLYVNKLRAEDAQEGTDDDGESSSKPL